MTRENDSNEMEKNDPQSKETMRADATREAWERHYGRQKSRQHYPDENLVRLLSQLDSGPALDLGCGSGRHLKLLHETGFAPLYGCDTSETSLEISGEICPSAKLFRIQPEAENNGFHIPLPDRHSQVVVCWGVLHYNSDPLVAAMLNEVCRVLRPGGVLIGTLRSVGDSHFRENPDMDGAAIRFFDEGDARELLGRYFDSVELGYAERSPVGALDQRVCHWIFRAGLPDVSGRSNAK